ALPRGAVRAVRRAPTRPHRAAPAPPRARQAEPCRGQRHPPHDVGAHRVDAHQTVFAVAAVGDDDGPVGERHEVQGQRADGDSAAGRPDMPAGGEQRRSVRQRSRDQTCGEERRAGECGQREEGAFEHGPEYGRSRDCRHPLRLRRVMTGLIFHLIPHTHWDREWYLPRAAFQARLVAVMDELIERLQAHPKYRSFLLDGQTVLIEDYLRARPDREADLRALVKTGRLQVGPWYVLPDEQIPSGEGLLRNLLLGAADAERLGGRLDVLYSPDAFGHPAAWP